MKESKAGRKRIDANPGKIKNIRVDPELWERAKQIAHSRGDSLSSVIRAGLLEYIAKYG
ncbi:hypothetical protein ACRQFN_02245 [Actinotignum sp. GS-2025e]|uniref:hypothetical protein n=1 Tax=unclassified Actinotignum TaxID=2632702 RepID=UPI003F45CBB0